MALESYFGLDAGEGMSASALEALREKMASAAAQIAAIKKEESKQKQKENELLKILSKFIKTSHKKDLVLLISRVLEQNVPAIFVLAIILLGNEEIQQQVNQFLLLKAAQSDEKALVFMGEDQSLPLKVRIEVDHWIKNMLAQAQESGQKLLKTAYDVEIVGLGEESDFGTTKYEEKKTIKVIIIQLIAFVLRDFLEQNKIEEDYQKLFDFSKFILTGILNKTEEGINNRKLLTDQRTD